MELFYTPSAMIDRRNGRLSIEGEEHHHLSRVLRKRVGAVIMVTDGQGLKLEARIESIGSQSLSCSVLAGGLVKRPSTSLTLALSMLKAPQRFDFFLEKAVELGVSTIIPMVSERTVSQPEGRKVSGKMERWRRIMVSAARQSKQWYFPELHEPMLFGDLVRLDGYDLKLIPFEASHALPSCGFRGKKSLFLIGGEGGFSQREVSMAQEFGFLEISFGRSILRAETAAIFAAAFVRSALIAEGDISSF